MEGGKLDRRIQIQRSTLTDDGFSQTEVWADHGSAIWASKDDVSDAERIRADQVAANITSRFTVRGSAFTADLTPKDRLTYRGRIYDIFGIKEIGRGEGFEITAGARADT